MPGPTYETLSPGDAELARKLERVVSGEVRFDAFTRGLYATDASHYQIEPLGVVFPRHVEDIEAVLDVARSHGAPVLPRGGGTSQCGQTVGRAVVIDTSRHLTAIGPVEDGHVEVEPGVVLERLNVALRGRRQWFPVDPSTGDRATIGGMAGNNSAGARSLRYGMMVDNVTAVEALLPDGRRLWLGEGGNESATMPEELAALRALYDREAEEIARVTPETLRNVAGYALERLAPDRENLAQLLVGSEGTLAVFTKLRLRLASLPAERVLGVCHFPDLLRALDAVQHIVALEPTAVELVDENVLRLAAERPDFRRAMQGFVRGEPGALLLVEFAADGTGARLDRRLNELDGLLDALGLPDAVVRAESQAEQADVWSVRKAGLSIVMSMAGPRKPISFIEDCAVPLEHLAEYASRVNGIFERHGAEGTWYAHASVGCLHVRPALNLKDPDDVRRMRMIAEETHEVVRAFGGTHSGEHGDGLLRSEFLEAMLGPRMTRAYESVKRTFDPLGLMNPGKIVDPPRMDDRTLFRYTERYAADASAVAERALPVVLDWTSEGGVLGAVERCNNNGACRRADPGVMCPSFRVTHDERHSTRGRANALRLAITGQLGDQGLDSEEMAEAMSLCISCKGCRRECPTGVDMAALKLEWQHHMNRRHGVPRRERFLAELPRRAPALARVARLVNALPELPGVRSAMEIFLGLAARRPLPRFARRPFDDAEIGYASAHDPPGTVLFVDTFSRWFEPEIARAAHEVLGFVDPPVAGVEPADGRPLCCGRTYLSAGMLDEARAEAERLVARLAPLARGGARIVGIEPSCVLTVRDELVRLVPTEEARLVAHNMVLFEEALEHGWARGETLPFEQMEAHALVHGHCHQKAFGLAESTLHVLGHIPGLRVSPVKSGCCGMAGAFGYRAEHYETSMALGELDLLPTVRGSAAETRIVAAGASCRAQIKDGTGRDAVHPAVVMREALPGQPPGG